MNTTTRITAPAARLSELPDSAPAAARALFTLLGRLRHGRLEVHLPAEPAQAGSADPGATRPELGVRSVCFGGLHGAGDLRASMHLANWSVCAAVLKSGDIGLAETYIDGGWSTPDLASLLGLFVANRDAIERAVYGTWWGALLYRVRYVLARNSRRGSRKNIHAHYDIGNDFYRLWLDEGMSYSSAWFDGDLQRSLPDAQQAKMQRALAEVRLAPGGRLLELGCGWGGLAEMAARDIGADVTGVTLSHRQLEHAERRIAAAGLGGRVALRLQDYRDVADGPYDAVVSIEMFEAVGLAYWGDFFAALHEQLVPGGRACIQSITIREDLFARYLEGTDFIQQYIFPGGLLPSIPAFEAAARKAGFEVERAHRMGADYAETLRRWRARFKAEEAGVRALGLDARFVRIWDFYLAYCEAAFTAGNTDVVQFTLRRA